MYGRRSAIGLPSQWSATQLPNWPVTSDGGNPLAAGLSGLWLLNTNNPVDLSGAGLLGNAGSNNAPSIVAGLNGPATVLNGSNQSITTPGLMSAVPTLTVSIWVSASAANFANPGANARFIANGHTDSDNTGFQFYWNGSNIKFEVGNGTTFGAGVSDAASFAANTWLHLVGVYNGTSVVLYVNGSQQATSSGLTGSVSSTTGIGIGFNPVYNGDYAAATFSNAAVWYRALSNAEVAQLYNEPYLALRPAVQRPYRTAASFGFVDSTTTSDAFAPSLTGSFAFSDTATSSDTVNGSTATNSSISDSAVSSDAFVSTFAAPANLSDGAATSGTYAVTSISLTFSDVSSASDYLVPLGFAASLSDTTSSSDILGGLLFADSATSSDSLGTTGWGFTLLDSISTSDSLTYTSTGSYSGLITDTVTTSDAAIVAAFSTSFVDNAIASDSFSSLSGFSNALSDSVDNPDNLFLAGFVGITFDNATSSDSLTPTAYGGLLPDSATTSDLFSTTAISLVVQDTASTATGFAATDFGATVADIASLSDAIIGSRVSTGSVDDAVSTLDTLTTATYGLGLTDTIGTSDTLPNSVAVSAAIADLATTTDVWAATAYSTPLSDTASSTDAVGTNAFGLALSDSIAATDSLNAVAYGAIQSDAANVSDNLTSLGLGAPLADATNVLDALAAIAFGSTLLDTAFVSDTIQGLGFSTYISDSLSANDAVLGSAFSGSLVDTATSADTIQPSLVAVVAFSDVLSSIIDGFTAVALLTGTVADSVAASDNQVGTIIGTFSIADAAVSNADLLIAGPPGLSIGDATTSSDSVAGSIAGHGSPSDTAATLDSFFASAISVAPLYLAVSETQTIAALRRFLQMVLPAGLDIFRTEINRVAEPLAADFVAMTPIGRMRLSTNYTTYADYYPTPYGARQTVQPTQVTIQLDVHGPNSADNSQIITTLFRDGYACQVFQTINPAIQPLYAEDPRQMVFDNGENQQEQRWIIDVTLQVNQTIITTQDFASSINVGLIEVDAVYPPLN